MEIRTLQYFLTIAREESISGAAEYLHVTQPTLSRQMKELEEELGKRDVKVLAYPQFQHNKKTVKWVEEVGINLQITNLAKLKGVTKPLDVKRIHVANTTSPEQLLEMIQKLTMK